MNWVLNHAGSFFPVSKMLQLSSTGNCYPPFQHTHGVVSTVWDINKEERKTFDRRMPANIYPSSSVFSTLLPPSSLVDISSFPHNLKTKFPVHFTRRPTKVCSHSMQLCLHMRQHESTFIGIACISRTNLRHAQNTGSLQALRHLAYTQASCTPPPSTSM